MLTIITIESQSDYYIIGAIINAESDTDISRIDDETIEKNILTASNVKWW